MINPNTPSIPFLEQADNITAEYKKTIKMRNKNFLALFLTLMGVCSITSNVILLRNGNNLEGSICSTLSHLTSENYALKDINSYCQECFIINCTSYLFSENNLSCCDDNNYGSTPVVLLQSTNNLFNNTNVTVSFETAHSDSTNETSGI